MNDEFVFNARQFYDFFKEKRSVPVNDEENLDSYFEVDHERGQPKEAMTQKEDSVENEDFFSPLKMTPMITRAKKALEDTIQPIKMGPEVSSTTNTPENACVKLPKASPAVTKDPINPSPGLSRFPKALSKSRSADNFKKSERALCGSMSKLTTNDKPNPIGQQEKTRVSRIDVPRNNLKRSKSVSRSRDNLNRLAQPKRQFTSTENLNDEYITMAEAIKKFESGTPVRFRSKPQINKGLPMQQKRTVPQSPKLTTKTRLRPTFAISREEQEKIELEEAKKFKIKAHPVSKKVLQGPLKPQPIDKRPSTVPKPFNLTEKARKPLQTETDTYQFQAKPVPNSLNVPFKPVFNGKLITSPHTPNFVRRINKNLAEKQLMNNNKEEQMKVVTKEENLRRTYPKPFSFEERDQNLIKKKKELIKKVLEEEKKAREFHANPVPKAVIKACLTKIKSTSDCASSSCKSEENLNLLTNFKARPADVLKMKPFEPKKPERYLIEISEFQLNTDRRAKEREEFEQKMKTKEEILAELKMREEREKLRLEEEERERLRKEATYKAQPIKKYKEVKIVPANKVTDPVSPKFHNRNKENVV